MNLFQPYIASVMRMFVLFLRFLIYSAHFTFYFCSKWVKTLNVSANLIKIKQSKRSVESKSPVYRLQTYYASSKIFDDDDLWVCMCLSPCVQCWSIRSLHRIRPFKQDFMLFSKYILIVAYKVFDWCWQIKWKLPTHGHSRVRFTRQLIITFHTWCVWCGWSTKYIASAKHPSNLFNCWWLMMLLTDQINTRFYLNFMAILCIAMYKINMNQMLDAHMHQPHMQSKSSIHYFRDEIIH